MKIKGIIDECFGDYKKASMYIAMPHCSFKCDKENKGQFCQNLKLASAPILDIDNKELIKRYLDNPITEAIVFGGLEPFDSFGEIYSFIKELREQNCNDDIIIYTGYNEDEITSNICDKLFVLLGNVYIKFGRFRPNEKSHYDKLLGVNLASSNQYAKRY